MRAVNPALGAAELKARLLSSADVKPGLSGTSVTGGRLNAAAAVAAARAAPTDPCGAVPPGPGCTSGGVSTTNPGPTGTPAPVAVSHGAGDRPRLGKPSLSRSKLTRKKSAALKFTLSRAAIVRLIIKRGSHRAMRTVSLHGKRGANRFKLRTRGGGHATLRRGRYRLTVVAYAGPLQSRVYTLRFSVR